MGPKQKAWKACSKYIRLRDAIDFCRLHKIDPSQFNRVEDLPVQCCDCKTIKSWIRMDAGHFIGRGLGGGSGAYFDERNIHAQAKRCNQFKQNDPKYHQFMVDKYGQKTIDELERRHRMPGSNDYKAIELHYRVLYNELVKGI